MFTSKELEGIPIPLQQTVASMEDRIMADLVERIKISGEISSTADWQINRLKLLGASDDYIKTQLQGFLQYSDREMNRLYTEVLGQAYIRDKALYTFKGKDFIPFSQNRELQAIIKATLEQTAGEFRNITQTMGFAHKVNGQMVFSNLSKYYQDTLDGAVSDVLTGSFNYDQVLKRVVSEMTSSGIRSVLYATGRSTRIESAARNALMTGYNQTISKMNDDLANKSGTEYFEIDWHGGARPSHQLWQGRVYSKKELETICGLGSADGLLGCNCYHSYFPFVPGASVRSYTDKELDRMNAKENKQKEYLGKNYSTYEATQKQRGMELLLRKQRRDVDLLQKGGAPADDIINAKSRYRSTNAQYVDFSEKMGIPQQKQRISVDGLGKLISGRTPVLIPEKDILVHRSVGAAGKILRVKLPNGTISKLAEGTKVTKVVTFAGAGTNRKIDVAEHLEKQYNISKDKWKKVRGDGYVIDENGITRHAELHWFETAETGRVKMKVKRYFDDES